MHNKTFRCMMPSIRIKVAFVKENTCVLFFFSVSDDFSFFSFALLDVNFFSLSFSFSLSQKVNLLLRFSKLPFSPSFVASFFFLCVFSVSPPLCTCSLPLYIFIFILFKSKWLLLFFLFSKWFRAVNKPLTHSHLKFF